MVCKLQLNVFLLKSGVVVSFLGAASCYSTKQVPIHKNSTNLTYLMSEIVNINEATGDLRDTYNNVTEFLSFVSFYTDLH